MPKHKYSDAIEDRLSQRIIDDEFSVAKRNKESDIDEFESLISLLDSEREPKQYDWMSDIRIPEFLSHMLTQSSLDANQYFQTRDFVEVYLEDSGNEAKDASTAAKELINRTLNQRHIHYYHKYMRAKSTNNLVGRTYALCWWEQQTQEQVVGTKKEFVATNRDVFGNPLTDINQQQAFEERETEVVEEIPIVDRFNFDILDNRNVFVDNTYGYDLQQKEYIFIRSETNKEKLLSTQEEMNYFNLSALDELNDFGETDTSKESYNKDEQKEKVKLPLTEEIDLIQRFGKYWAVVEEKDDKGYPTKIKPGIDKNGNKMPKAEYIETIIAYVTKGSNRVLVRFQATPYIAADGVPYKPIIRGLCYIHPTDDGGMGDGKHTKELQLAIDDTFNISNDRVMLATLPTLKVKTNEAEDNPEVYIKPGHNIPLNNPAEDVQELQISDDINGALNQLAFLTDKMQQLDAIYPTTMGQTPAIASTTATAVAGAEQRTNIRSNYKSLTFEFTFLTELYWMIQQMTGAFAFPETGVKLMGDKVFNFDPAKDYFYKPVSHFCKRFFLS